MSDKVVTRFAPSPTGYLHVGGARTALFNWLWARRTGGTFILRIEDTDQKRNTPTAMRQVMADLRWLGIDWDEGPEVGGPNGPYLQSQRTDIYDKYIRQLLAEGKAYYCFESAEELDAMRKKAEAAKQGFAYVRPESLPSEQDAEKARAEGRPVTVRFAMPEEGQLVVDDVVRGQVTFGATELSDFIIQKSDGFPTYNFACVVDDYLMGITHIIRGQEHLMNTPGQQALWQALFGDHALPKYAHMSVTVSDSGGKLSKRERPRTLCDSIKGKQGIDYGKLAGIAGMAVGDLESFIKGKTTPDMPAVDAMAKHLGVALPEINIVDFSKSGYLPETMVNFLALLGWNPGDGKEIMTVDELIASFDLSRLTKSNSLFDRKKLLAFNTEHIRMVPAAKLLSHTRQYLDVVDSPVGRADDELLLHLIEICQGARTLADIERKSRFLFVPDDAIEYDEKAVRKVLLKSSGLEILGEVRKRLAGLAEFTEQGIEDMLRSLAEEKEVGLGKVAQPLRVAITGTTISPPIFDSVQLLGIGNTLARIDVTLSRFAQGSGEN